MSNNNTLKVKFGIRAKLLLPIIMGFFIFIYVLLFIWQPSQLEKSKQAFITEQVSVLKTLSPALIQNILSNDLPSLHSMLEHAQVIHKNEWLYIQIVNQDKKEIYPIFTEKPKSTVTSLEITIALEEKGEKYGVLYLLADWKNKKENQIQNIYRINTWAIILFITIAMISFILQTSWIYQPITKLIHITSQFSDGNYKAVLPKTSKDEIGLLTTSIDHLRNKIQLTLNELTDKEKMQRAILDTAPDAIITLDKQGLIQSFNPGAEKIFLYKKDEVIHQPVTILMPEKYADAHKKGVKSFDIKHPKIIGQSLELAGTRKNCETFPLELTLNAIEIDDELLFTGIIRDITERKKIDRIKDEFISTVSHELRTPLTAIKGSLTLITQVFTSDLPEQALTMLDVANRNVERLLTLINDILDVSKLESGEFNFNIKPIKLKPFINDTINLNQEYAKEHKTVFKCIHCHDDVNINADRDRLVQVMSNLLSNAAKYSPADTAVEIFTEINDDMLRVNIKDYGSGIPEDFQEKLFEKFTQSNSGDTREVGGTGLGLSISKMIIEKLGGNIGFKTIKGKETTFYFELPILYS